MANASVTNQAIEGRTSLFYLIFGRQELPRELAMAYWTNPHVTLVARTQGIYQYRAHILDIARSGGWPEPVGVQAHFPLGWMPDGLVEAAITDPMALAPTPLMDSVLNDERNFLARGLAYVTKPNGSRWHRDELTPATADLQRPETRMIALFRRRYGITQKEFSDFVQGDLVEAIMQGENIVETRSAIFSPYDERIWPSPGVAHEHPLGRQYHGAVILAAHNRIAIERLFRSDAFGATLERQAKLFECLHSICVKSSIFMVENAKLQLPALRGFASAQIINRVGAVSQTEEPVLSQVLSVPRQDAVEEAQHGSTAL